ncbi:MAG: Gfo/Idh/MocA family oxidoreductase [Armatimonadetes bacterium]|nr:Gfo/Idh/MocA family oxidoreductase [Armatimonadota bacterium]MDW8122357.1 Gfo/Idh/MocA family oxidoreductase [Armatimonadota bacterium]
MTDKPVGIGVIGFGLMGRVHTYAWRSIPLFYDGQPCPIELVAVCDVDERAAKKGMEQGGFSFWTTDFREVVHHPKVDLVDICVPNRDHAPIIREALAAKKHIYCEKPLALNYEEAKALVKEASAVSAEGIKFQLVSEYRFFPAMLKAKELMTNNFVGRLFHFRGCYLHSGYVDPNRPLEWRLRKEIIGGGVLVDLGPHLLDLMLYLLEGVDRPIAVSGAVETFIKERPLPEDRTRKAPVEVDDAAWALIRFESGAVGTVEFSRVATGTEDELRLEVHGDRGALGFNLMEPNWLWTFDRTLPANRWGYQKLSTVQKYPAPASYPSPKFTLGWTRSHIHAQFSFLKAIVDDTPPKPDFTDGLKVHELMEAIYRSAASGQWVSLPLDGRPR